MSDNEGPTEPEVAASALAEEVAELVMEEVAPPTAPDSRTEEAPIGEVEEEGEAAPNEVSTDVAPTRKTRKRPEHKAPPPAEEDPSPPQTAETKPEPQKANESAVQPGGWGYWGSWGKSLLSTATATVATVGQGISTVIEKAETTLGIPTPDELSAQAAQEENTDGGTAGAGAEGEAQHDVAKGGAFGMLSSLSNVVQNTGKTVITGGLDALEFIGKKTMDVIAEGDPGFKKTKGLMIRTTTLSQVLREAKEREEQQTNEDLSSDVERKAHYGMLFDEFQGLAHLEALESLSRESDIKVKSVLTSMSGPELALLKADLEELSEPFSLMEFEDDDDDTKEDSDGVEFTKELTEAVSRLHLSVTAAKLSQARKNIHDRIAEVKLATAAPTKEEAKEMKEEEVEEEKKEEEKKEEEEEEEKKEEAEEVAAPKHTPEDVHTLSIRSLAELTAKAIEHFHKVAQVVLHNASDTAPVSTADQAKVLAQITVMLCKEISLLSKSFTSCLATVGANEKGEVLNPLITGVFLEASNSATYIQDAFQLLRSVLQLAHIQRSADILP
ncbi:protein FAM114A2 isoform X2 [Engraulis encrasicolus]|uniref:protein FAM114A2 isoform X2 n=1 Tax=Engraulis encrasicolus TaxID=184585 RepID=UPI002FD30151